ncbi:hypothetical protein ONS95_007604 [Cadophora gregata]|uniref:uncharacterized protein n=1 Tax=Cadophora gregata TaxID=51156 RepID=UPI0026DA9ADC|nr:uncharacterized protein ONS95_007604 [Cadophora gregata]KAK0125981.1 hypothetical protein ONS95_007604 [Cadophora gregata]
MRDLESGDSWKFYKDDWEESPKSVNAVTTRSTMPPYSSTDVWSAWPKEFVDTISHSRAVESGITLGSVLAISLQDLNAGYSSTAAKGLQKKLLNRNPELKIRVRVVGNVLYMLASQTSKPESIRSIEKFLLAELD